MKLGIIADDFTGASDIALTLAEGGMRCVRYVGIPDALRQGMWMRVLFRSGHAQLRPRRWCSNPLRPVSGCWRKGADRSCSRSVRSSTPPVTGTSAQLRLPSPHGWAKIR